METLEYKISQSEVTTFNSCQKRHQFSFEAKLEPRRQSEAIVKGNAGHKFLEVFLQTRDEDAALMAAIEVDPVQASMIMARLKLWIKEVFPTLGWREIVETEKTHYLTVDEFEHDGNQVRLIFPFTADALVRNVRDELILVDHKFLSDPYSDDTVKVAKQLPLYIGALRAEGVNVSHAMYNIIRTRSNATEYFVQTKVNPSDKKVQTLFREQVEVMRAIAIRRLEKPKFVLHASDPHACKWCPFVVPCNESLDGKIDKNGLRANFQRNSYGY